MKHDLVEVSKGLEKTLKATDRFTQIATRSATEKNLAEFHVFTETKLAKIADMMPEINRATRSFGRSKTQTTNRLMTLTMLADASPYRAIRQCLAQIEKKRGAVKENRFKLLKDKVNLEKLQSEWQNEDDIFEKQLKEIEIEQLIANIGDTMLYIEGALKSIASFQSSYFQICKNKNIPEDWDERDMERAEIEHHLRIAFLHAYRDVMAHGRLGMGTLEYLQQFGVHPQTAQAIVKGYVNATANQLDGTKPTPEYENLEVFLDGCVNQFKECYKQVLRRIGLDSLYETWYMYMEDQLTEGQAKE